MTKEEKFEYDYIEEMEKKCFTGDDKNDHINADSVLIGLLNDLGYEKLTKKWKEVVKRHTYEFIERGEENEKEERV